MPNHSTATPVRRRPAVAAGLTAATMLVATLVSATAADASSTGSTGAAAAAAQAAATRTQVARWGAGWLADQIEANGGHLESFGFPDPSDTAYAVIGLHAAGVGRAASAQAIAYLKTELTTALQASDGSDDPGRLGFYVMAAVSAGQDPRHFGGSTPANNLVARLLATARTTGPDAGLLGTADPTYDGAFRQGVALAGLSAAGVARTNPTVSAAIGWLTGQQCANGLWTSYRADTGTRCPAANPNTFAGPDTNSTGMAVQGLAAYGRHPRSAAVLARLKVVQAADGGFPFLAAPGQGSDPNSTATVIQAILAEGGSPGAARWNVSGATPYTALAGFQLGCSDAAGDRGAFFYPGDRSPNILASVQAVPAAAGKVLPVQPSTPSTATPAPSCSSPAVAVGAVSKAATTASSSSALAGTAGRCPGTTGVTVAVDFKAFGGTLTVRCAPGTPATGLAALQQAGFTPTGTAQYGLAFICRINGLPTAAVQSCLSTPPASAHWAYYHANKGAKAWTTSALGASSYKPQQGSIEGWAFGAGVKPSKTPKQIRAGA